LYGKERGVESLRIKPAALEKLINCKLIHILGNHDKNNKVKGGMGMAIKSIGKNTALISHFPPWDTRIINVTESIKGIDVFLCGHVHDKWKLGFFKNKPVINVGVDVWSYRPVSKSEHIKFNDKL
jgi:calcineurin-like phosphoesterase family protein